MGTPVTLTPTQVLNIAASDLGDITTLHYLCVKNLNASIDGDFDVEIM